MEKRSNWKVEEGDGLEYLQLKLCIKLLKGIEALNKIPAE